jgi:metalloendopeptidase OMA1, mitochondrial
MMTGSHAIPLQRGTRAGWICLVICFAVQSTGCGNSTGDGPGHRPQALALDAYQEANLGKQAYDEILKDYRAKGHIVKDGAELEQIREVGKKIVRASENDLLQREINLRVKGYVWEWEFTLVQENQANAFCLPGGKVVVFSGLLSVAETPDQLATVLSHEIAHALAHHASERIARAKKYGQAMNALNGNALDHIADADERRQMVGLLGGGGKLQSLAFDRQQESEADHIGLFLMAFAGYDPEQALVFWQRMERLSSGKYKPEILSDHPSDAHRIEQIRVWKTKAIAAKRAFDAGQVVKSR